jgi:hypothetical protein
LVVQLGTLPAGEEASVVLTLQAPVAIGAVLQFDAQASSPTNTIDSSLPMSAVHSAISATTPESFAGLINPAGSPQRTGAFSINTTPGLAFSAKVIFAGATFSLAGKFNSDGTFSRTLANTTAGRIALALKAPGPETIEGTLTAGGASYSFAGRRTGRFTEGSPAPAAGRYTVLLDPADPPPAGEDGEGFATLTVSATGAVTLLGRLSDGVSLSQSVNLGSDQTFPLFALLYGAKGVITGNVAFRDQPRESDADGAMHWVKPARFDTQLTFHASRFQPADGAPILPSLAASGGSADATLHARGINPDIEATLAITLDGQVTVAAPNPRNLALSIDRGTGLLTGTFTPTGHPPVRIMGAAHPKSERIGGFFANPGGSGVVRIRAHE